MSLSDIRIVVVFCLVVGFVAMISAVFGIRGTYFIGRWLKPPYFSRANFPGGIKHIGVSPQTRNFHHERKLLPDKPR